jgi:hypothetical protein
MHAGVEIEHTHTYHTTTTNASVTAPDITANNAFTTL